MATQPIRIDKALYDHLSEMSRTSNPHVGVAALIECACRAYVDRAAVEGITVLHPAAAADPGPDAPKPAPALGKLHYPTAPRTPRK